MNLNLIIVKAYHTIHYLYRVTTFASDLFPFYVLSWLPYHILHTSASYNMAFELELTVNVSLPSLPSLVSPISTKSSILSFTAT
jgi:hypothetical protein